MGELKLKNSIKKRILLLIIGISFLISFTLSFLIGEITKSELEKDIGKSLKAISNNVINLLDRESYNRLREIELIAKLDTFVDENGDNKKRREILDNLKENLSHYAWIGFADGDTGKVLAGSDGYLEGKNASVRPWYKEGKTKAYIGDIHDALLLAKLLPNPSNDPIYLYDVAYPSINKNGELVGILCGHLSFGWVKEVLKTVEKDNNIEVFLLSKNNTIISGTKFSDLQELKDFSLNAYEFINSGKSVGNIDWGNNKNYITTYAKSQGFKKYEGFGWKVLVRENTNEAYKRAEDLQHKIIVYGLILGSLFLIIGSLFATRVITPILILTQKVRLVAQNKADEEAIPEFKTGDEIEVLSKDIKKMIIALKENKSKKDDALEKLLLVSEAFEECSEGIILTDNNHKVILANKKFCEFTNFNMEEVLYKNIDLLEKESSNISLKEIFTNIDNTNRYDGILEFKVKDRFIQKAILVKKIVDNQDDIKNFIIIFKDL